MAVKAPVIINSGGTDCQGILLCEFLQSVGYSVISKPFRLILRYETVSQTTIPIAVLFGSPPPIPKIIA